MKRAIFLLLALGACSSNESTDDAGADGAVEASTLLDGACAMSVAAYCDAHACPSSPTSVPTCNGQIYEGCGFVNSVGSFGVDTGETYVFGPDGGLVGIETYFNGDSKCAAGPADATSVPSCSCPQGCTMTDASCGD